MAMDSWISRRIVFAKGHRSFTMFDYRRLSRISRDIWIITVDNCHDFGWRTMSQLFCYPCLGNFPLSPFLPNEPYPLHWQEFSQVYPLVCQHPTNSNVAWLFLSTGFANCSNLNVCSVHPFVLIHFFKYVILYQFAPWFQSVFTMVFSILPRPHPLTASNPGVFLTIYNQ